MVGINDVRGFEMNRELKQRRRRRLKKVNS